jgi:molybdenum-dependent DNA-binding transcriptional regulator ModE
MLKMLEAICSRDYGGRERGGAMLRRKGDGVLAKCRGTGLMESAARTSLRDSGVQAARQPGSQGRLAVASRLHQLQPIKSA